MPWQTQDFAASSGPTPVRESPLGLAVRRILRKRSSRVAFFALGVIVLLGLLAPLVAPYDPVAQPDIVAQKDLPPSLAHPFGTDPYSRDVLSPEDNRLCESVQRGLASRGYRQGRFVVDAERSALSEHAVHHFHRLVAEALNI